MHSSWDSEPISRAMTSSSILLSELRTYTHNARWSPPVCPAYTRHLRTARGSLLQRPADPPPPPHCSSRKLCLLLRDPCRTHSPSFLNGSPIWPAPCPHERALVASHPDRRRLRPRESVRLRGRSVVPTILQGPPLPFGTNSAFLCPLPPVKAKSSATV